MPDTCSQKVIPLEPKKKKRTETSTIGNKPLSTCPKVPILKYSAGSFSTLSYPLPLRN